MRAVEARESLLVSSNGSIVARLSPASEVEPGLPVTRPATARLLETELRRVAFREGIPGAAVSLVLDRVTLHALPRSVYTRAGLLPGKALRLPSQ